MYPSTREPTLRDVLDDPIVQILMHRDAIPETELIETLDDARRRFSDAMEADASNDEAA